VDDDGFQTVVTRRGRTGQPTLPAPPAAPSGLAAHVETLVGVTGATPDEVRPQPPHARSVIF
jgi:hypothetical protein